jgi:hypothetical protein
MEGNTVVAGLNKWLAYNLIPILKCPNKYEQFYLCGVHPVA